MKKLRLLQNVTDELGCELTSLNRSKLVERDGCF